MKFKNISEVSPKPWRCEFHYPQDDGSVRVEWVDPEAVLLLESRVRELVIENTQWKELHAKHCGMVIPGETDSADAYRIMYFKMKEVVDTLRTLTVHHRGLLINSQCACTACHALREFEKLDRAERGGG